jgi:hypothetical protein
MGSNSQKQNRDAEVVDKSTQELIKVDGTIFDPILYTFTIVL